jgi:CheY-like chemotaxis protein
MSDRRADILLLEDNPEEARLIWEILREVDGALRIQSFAGGREALVYLKAEKPVDRAGLPRLILLDLNLPEMDGREFLKIVKTDETIKRIPVVVLTGCEGDDDVKNAYRHSANGYVIKPPDLEAYREAIRGIGEFWLSTVTLPPQ